MSNGHVGLVYEAIRDTKPPPCEQYKCDNFRKCADEKLACKSFQYYVTVGRTTNPRSPHNEGPNEAIYKKLYNAKDDEDASS